MGRCPLCLRDGRAMTREHVFAHWLIREVRGGKLTPSRAAAAEVPERIGRVTAEVCADCNAGWMSGLEVGFRRIVFARPRSGAIPAADRVALSRWFTKTAALLAHAHGATLVGGDRLTALLAGMPDGVEVVLARRRRPPQPLDYALSRHGDHLAFVAVFVDDLVAHVAPRGTLASERGTRLWPLRTHALRWETLPVRSAREREQVRGV